MVTIPVFLLADISAESKMADKLKSNALSVLKFYFMLAYDFYRFKTSFPKRGSNLWGCKNLEFFLLFCNYFIPCHRKYSEQQGQHNQCEIRADLNGFESGFLNVHPRPIPIVLGNFWATFCGFSNLEQVLPFRAIFEKNIGLEHISSTKKSTISWKTSIHANFLKAYHVINLLNT